MLFIYVSIHHLNSHDLILFSEIVDSVLEEDDLNNDGYLTYLEYVLARKREEARETKEKDRQQHDMNRKRDP